MCEIFNVLLLASKYVEYSHKCWCGVCSEVGNILLLLLYGQYVAMKSGIAVRVVVVRLTAAIYTCVCVCVYVHVRV